MATYTTLSEVRRILKASDNEVIRFSDSIVNVNLKAASSTPGQPGNPDFGFDFEAIQFDPSFDKKFRLVIKFTSPTEFNAYKIVDNINQEFLLTQGASIASDYVTPDGLITLPSTCWFGTIEAGDEVKVQFDPHISDEAAEKYIEDAEVQVDTMLSASTVDDYEDGEVRHFDPTATDPARPVPPAIAVATTYLAAYYLYTDTFASIYKEETSTDKRSYAARWKQRAEKYVKAYIETEGYAPPEAAAFPKFIDQMGVEGEGPGLAPMAENADTERDAQTEDIFGKLNPGTQ